ncbi:leucine-rich repeat-containing protein 15 [Anabrus simplex]|uniref:leucine-rich repeat-containing protein 15 n=1 Tax=Anabrus simplex TaxID=316456 RepID=UPI0035A38FEC
MAIMLGLLPLLLGLAVPSASQFECPAVCRCVLDSSPTIFNCSHRDLRGFPAAIDPQINIVDLSYNTIRWLPDDLAEYTELQEIYLCNNLIESIANTTFKGLKNLKLMDLADNGIRSLKRIQADTLVKNLPALVTLNLSRNRLEFKGYDPGNIINSPTLEVLDISGCGIDDISDLEFLSRLPNIKYLNLAHNNLMWISGLVSATLVHLDVSRCKLDSIHPAALSNLPALERLDVSRNERFTFSMGTFSNSLKVLNAISCYVRLRTLQGFPNLTRVDLRNNSVVFIANNTFNNSQLREINLAGNSIGFNKIYPFTNLPRLEVLNLATNGILRLDWNTFSTNKDLKVLNLSSNALRTLANFSIPSLKILDASHCSISELSETFLNDLSSLQYLNLSDNKLETTPYSINSKTLIELDLSFNRLSTLTNTTFASLPKLKLLDLRGNRFTTTFRAVIFAANTNLRNIKLTDNPWICNCEDHEFQLLHRFLSVRHVENIKRLVCSSPSNFAGMKWQEACYDTWYPTVSETSMVQRYGVISIIVVLAAGGVMIIVSAVRRGYKERKTERRQREDDEARERALQIHEMMIRRELESISNESSPEMRPRSRPRRTPSEITQPPTYEEALLMSRSQQDLLDRGVLYDNNKPAPSRSEPNVNIAPPESDSDGASTTERRNRPATRQYGHSDSRAHQDSGSDGASTTERRNRPATRQYGHSDSRAHQDIDSDGMSATRQYGHSNSRAHQDSGRDGVSTPESRNRSANRRQSDHSDSNSDSETDFSRQSNRPT